MNITNSLSPILKEHLTKKFRGKNILIWGLAREGISTFKLLKQFSPQTIYLLDEKSDPDLEASGVEVIKLSDPLAIPGHINLDFVFKTPGIPRPRVSDLFPEAEILSNTYLFFELIELLQAKHPQLKTIGVTGTKGKTTTTSVIYHVLHESGKQTLLGGNIGIPPLDLILELSKFDLNQPVYLVLELSCHQLDFLPFSPQIAVIQSITPDHLDYYHDFDRYCQAKSSITKHQKSGDVVYYFADSEPVEKLAKLSPGQQLGFGFNESASEVKLIEQSHYQPRGAHNIINALPAVLITQKENIPAATIQSALASFEPVSHRLELVREIDGVSFFDDSASSAPEATMAALTAFPNDQIVLIAGGSEKDVSFANLAQSILSSPVKYLVLFPTTGDLIYQAIKEIDPDAKILTNSTLVSSMTEAVQVAWEQAQKQAASLVLLSPGCASFNMFKNFNDRGEQYQQAVKNLETL